MTVPKIKVCGMKYPENTRDVVNLKPDYLGLIFYPASKRFVENSQAEAIVPLIPKTIKKVGVFVNASVQTIVETIRLFSLELVQLHGNEPVDVCREVRRSGVGVIKAFGVDEHFDFRNIETYNNACDFYLFDTRTEQHGGSGLKFNWKILKQLNLAKPLFLSGGIGPDDAAIIKELKGIDIYAVDINSKFEDEPAFKNMERLQKFFKDLRNNEIQTKQ